MKRTLLYLCLAAAFLLLGACQSAQEQTATNEEASNPFVGTWVMNPDRSMMNHPEYAMSSDIVKIEEQDNGLKFTLDRVDTAGNSIHTELDAKYDGADYPVIGGAEGETTSLRRVNDNSFELVNKTNGEETTRVEVLISEDGRTSTATLKAKDAEGQEGTSTFVYDKQE